MKPPRRTGSAFDRAEAAFKSATSKPVEAAPKPAAVPEGKELVSLRLDRAPGQDPPPPGAALI